MKFLTILSSVLAFLPTLISGVVIPGADTPEFYLVATGPDAGSTFLPLRLYGGSGGYSTLTTGPIGKFYFYQGALVAADPSGSTFTYRPNIGAIQTSTGCTAYGQLGFAQGGSTDKCARYSSFQIQSDTENSQLGAKLVFNYVGGFYVCGSVKDVWYKVNPTDGPTGCTPIDLYTLPVVQ